MIKQFRIENFKSFFAAQELKFAPITLVYGPNSSGKSSIIQSLMLLKQSMLSPRPFPGLITSGESISMGSFGSLVHGHDDNLDINFSIEYTANYNAEDFIIKNSYRQLFGNNDIRTSEFCYSPAGKDSSLKHYAFSCRDTGTTKVNYEVSNFGTSTEPRYRFSAKDKLRTVLGNRLKISPSDAKSWMQLDASLDSDGLFFSPNINLPLHVEEGAAGFVNDYIEKTSEELKNLFGAFKYLGPLRSAPKRIYSSELFEFKKGEGKHNLGWELYQRKDELLDDVNGWLEEFSIPYTIDVNNLGDRISGDVISVQLKDLRNHAVITPADVGFGIGQVLPIILEALVSQRCILCVEQPEIHLHPKLQAHLGDLFIRSVKEDGLANQWLIETHSEALMLRILRRIREGSISKDLVSVLYVDSGDNGAQVTQLPIDDDGDFLVHWPGGFFEERLDETFGA